MSFISNLKATYRETKLGKIEVKVLKENTFEQNSLKTICQTSITENHE